MNVLGAIIAGGRSRRFGSDKALALIEGKPMLAHVIAALEPQVDQLVICGREWPGLQCLPDRPAGGLGPLAGLNAALFFAKEEGFGAVLSAPVDVLPLPSDLAGRLGTQGPAVFGKQHLVGWWPADLSEALERHLEEGHRSLHGWIDAIAASRVADPSHIANINFRSDLN